VNPGVPVAAPLARGAGRLLRGARGRDTGWLIPAAAVVAAWGITSRRRQRRDDPLRACFILWGGWLVIFFVVFSVVTVLQPYYAAALSPPVAAIIGTGVAAAWSREDVPVSRSIGLAVIVVGTAGYAAWLVSASAARVPGWLFPAIIAVGIAAAGVIAWSLAPRRPVPFAAALAAVSLAPAAASVSLAARNENAFDTPFESARLQEDVTLAAGQQATAGLKSQVPILRTRGGDTRDLMAAQSVGLPSLLIYDSGLEVLPIGGLDGTTPSPTLAQLQADIRNSVFHLAQVVTATDPQLAWITGHCVRLSKTLYFCTPSDGD